MSCDEIIQLAIFTAVSAFNLWLMHTVYDKWRCAAELARRAVARAAVAEGEIEGWRLLALDSIETAKRAERLLTACGHEPKTKAQA